MNHRIAHMVYFTLHDQSPENIAALVDSCNQYLDQHPGLEYFAVGQRNQDLNRPVNDRDYHVSLHTIFADRAAHDTYQTAPRHLEFIEKNRPNWKTVRVFDSDLEPPA